jgi:hypothetical protein
MGEVPEMNTISEFSEGHGKKSRNGDERCDT